MKKLLIVSFVSSLLLSSSLLSLTANAQEVRLVPSDNSSLTDLCIASASSNRPLHETAAAHGVARHEIPQVRCNGMPLSSFAAKYGKSPGDIARKDREFSKEVTRKTSSLQ